MAAVRRIHSYLDDARHLSGERGTATAQRRMPGTRRRLFDFFEDPSDWLTQHSDGGSVHGRGYTLYCDHDYADDRSGEANLIVPSDGIVDYGIVETKPPEYTVATWTWIRLPAGRTGSRRQDGRRGTVLIPAQPQMTVRFDLMNAGRDDGTPTTLVRVTHDHVPVEWVDDLTAYWRWTLERGDYDLDLSDARRRGYSR